MTHKPILRVACTSTLRHFDCAQCPHCSVSANRSLSVVETPVLCVANYLFFFLHTYWLKCALYICPISFPLRKKKERERMLHTFSTPLELTNKRRKELTTHAVSSSGVENNNIQYLQHYVL